MPRIWRHIINIAFGILLVSILTGAYLLGSKGRQGILCKGTSITITDSSMNQFITPAQIRRYLDEEYPDYMGMPIDEIDLTRVEEILDEKTAVQKCQAYTTKDSLLNIKVTQRKPIVRFQKGDKGFYADKDGLLFPLQTTYTSHVMVIDGKIPLKNADGYLGSPESDQDKEWLRNMIGLVNYIESSRTWRGKIVQIHISEKGDIILIPREGREQFLFGQADNISEKFSKMEIYYKSIQEDKGEGYYGLVDVRYEGQIVCSNQIKKN